MANNISVSLLVGYPLIIHGLILAELHRYAVFYLLLVIGWLLAANVVKGRWLAVAMLTSVLLYSLWMMSLSHAMAAMYLPPVVICAGLALFFGQSLLRGRTPVVTSIAEFIEGGLTDEMRRYTRRVTQLWLAVSVLLVIETIALGVFARPETWSAFTNIYNYVFIAVMLLGEYAYRRLFRRFEHQKPFGEFVKGLMSYHKRRVIS